jgi:ApeA N-terminal domain 1
VTQTLSAETPIIGEQIREDQVFDHVLIRLTYLREWASVHTGCGEPHGEASRYSIPYEGPRDRTATLTDERSVTLRTVDDLSTSSSSIHGDQETQFVVDFPTPVRLQEVIETVASFRDLVTFAARQSATVVSLTVFCPGVLLAPGLDIQRPLELHYPLAGQSRTPRRR